MISIIKQTIDQYEAGKSRTDIVMGVVSSVDPLKIRVDARFEISGDFIRLSPFCRAYTTTIASHNHNYTDSSDAGVANKTTDTKLAEITLWGDLELGENVLMLRCLDGQLFYVLERGGLVT